MNFNRVLDYYFNFDHYYNFYCSDCYYNYSNTSYYTNSN